MSTQDSPDPFDCIPPYRIVPNFLGDDLIERLLSHAHAHEKEFTPTGVGTPVRRIDPEIRLSHVLRDFGALRDELDARFRTAMPQAMTYLKLMPFELAHCEI